MGSKSTNNNKNNITQADGHFLTYLRSTFNRAEGAAAGPAGPSEAGIQATGGFITNYEDPDDLGTYYRSHLFTETGTFAVTTVPGDFPDTVEYVVVAGGGGGGGYGGTPVSYRAGQSKGSNTIFDDGGPNPISASGGGTGGAYSVANPNGPGGSGGGGAAQPTTTPQAGGNGTSNQGYGGGTGFYDPPNIWRGAGGGGAGAVGFNGGPHAGAGSVGGDTSKGGTGLYTKALSGTKIGLAGGGAGGGRRETEGSGMPNIGPDGPYGGGQGGGTVGGTNGIENTGGGGGGGDGGGAGGGGGGAGGYRSSVVGELSGGGVAAESVFPVTAGTNYTVTIGAGGAGSGSYGNPTGNLGDRKGGGNGGKGVVIVRYKISGLTDNVTTKATGGQVYQWTCPSGSPIADGSSPVTVHAFVGAGKFVTPSSFNETVEYFVVGGGGGGGAGGSAEGSGGGGAGGVLTGTMPIGGGLTIPVTVGSGGVAGLRTPIAGTATNGGDSTFGPTITAYGGGKGSDGANLGLPEPGDAAIGGSGGGGGYLDNSGADGLNPTTPTGNVAPFTNYTPGTTQGYAGGDYTGAPNYSGGGGGGAGGAGVTGAKAHGGIGVQMPATFQNPNAMSYAKGYPGPGSPGLFWVGGGGGGGTYNSPVTGGGKGGNGPTDSGDPYAGGGDGGASTTATRSAGWVTAGREFSGGGGGGSAQQSNARNGGSGIVLIAYPT